MSELDKLCEELCKTKEAKKLAKAIKFGQVILTVHAEEITEIRPNPRIRVNGKIDT